MSKKKKSIIMIILIFFVLIGAAAFPIYNFGKEYDQSLTLLIVIETVILYFCLGAFEKSTFTKAKIQHIILLNGFMVLLSLLCRYLLEFGEVSNTYNFTPSNISFHIAVTLLISVITWGISQRRPWLDDK